MRFAVESWDPAYGSSVADTALESANEPVDPAVEVPVDAWRPITPGPVSEVTTVLFVDGVRRIDSRVWINDDGITRPGLCASVAAGAVRCEPGSASLVMAVVERGLYTAAGNAASINTARGGTYELKPASGDEDGDLYLGVHSHMTALETRVSTVLNGAQLVVFDGPLRGRDKSSGVGYIKTQHVQYLEPDQQRVVFALEDGQRTPLFAIGGRFARWSWYLRLPGPRSHGASGIVRLELPGVGDAAGAAERADEVSAALPRFASEAHKEPRAPQNLYPIAGLEHQLRHRLGDSYLLERALRSASQAGV